MTTDSLGSGAGRRHPPAPGDRTEGSPAPPRLPETVQMRAWACLLRSYRLVMDRLDEELGEERGMSLSWFDVLVQLSLAGGRLKMNELAASIVLSKSGLTRRIDRMEAAGYVAREWSRSDRRVAYAVLTSAGVEALEAALPVHLRGIEEHFSRHVSDSDAVVLEDVLGRVGDAARGQDGPAASG
jgi:DNA-binding MarR family transcriptional regulator